MDLHLRDHTALITGGASGIGLATARLFAQEGARIILWDRADNVAGVASDLATKFGVTTLGQRVDISDWKGVQEATAGALQHAQAIDHVVHAAAIGSGKFGFPFWNLEPKDWPRTIDINIQGMVHVAHALTPSMVAQKQGTFVFIASVAGQIGSQTDPPYSASKAANINFAQCMAKDLAQYGVRVNTICPGMVQTPLNRAVWQAWHDQQPPEARRSYEEWAGEKVAKVVPLGRWQTPDDVADAIAFLSSDRAQHITGQTINVDGGFVMHW